METAGHVNVLFIGLLELWHNSTANKIHHAACRLNVEGAEFKPEDLRLTLDSVKTQLVGEIERIKIEIHASYHPLRRAELLPLLDEINEIVGDNRAEICLRLDGEVIGTRMYIYEYVNAPHC